MEIHNEQYKDQEYYYTEIGTRLEYSVHMVFFGLFDKVETSELGTSASLTYYGNKR